MTFFLAISDFNVGGVVYHARYLLNLARCLGYQDVVN